MQIIIDNEYFEFDLGCKVLKLKYKECPDIEQVYDLWDAIVPLSTQEILYIPNLEQRRIALFYLSVEQFDREIEPVLVDRAVLPKTTTWINSEGKLETVSYDDVYELYKVSSEVLSSGLVYSWSVMADCYYVKFKDTSTNREYLLWVDGDKLAEKTAISAIAWTITTNVPVGSIQEIYRQGDCILIKPMGEYVPVPERHLSAEEYLTLLYLES